MFLVAKHFRGVIIQKKYTLYQIHYDPAGCALKQMRKHSRIRIGKD